ncbi:MULTISPECIES: OmpH family outer membrane protein [unclassified Agarivorans]|uniref:OmpH family outer membrane protein n=1 Tax=unclassified Agarivorans TaxID=2636026 RepID=UPI0010ECDC4E|nr:MULTISPECIES: OmpH family outer membrane protein [unclassified Agarivorans]MDO6687379.1 OmpH family outer membrane protein [Agarivorans sp. 3_MG-2023]MDO6717037.1 OmpH family outer membrane protein [Agarivorans sp. 2_MG-2023]GDY25694.1 outer membrane protein [Agarivorans sp. Toyoura001]
MKKLIAAVALAVTMMTPSFSALAEAKIAVINIADVFQQLPQRDTLQKTLKDEFEVRVQEVRGLEAEMQRLYDKREKDGELLGQQEVTKITRQLETMQAEYKLKRKNLEEDQRRRGAEEQQKLMVKVQEAIVEVSKSQGYDLVLPLDATAYASDSLDITKLVIQQVSKSK